LNGNSSSSDKKNLVTVQMAGKRHCWYEAKESKLIYEKAKVSAWDFGDSLLLSVVK